MILDNYREFLDKIFEDLEARGVDVSQYELDHIGYQSSSDVDYDNLKPEFEKIAELLSENLVGGRRVAIFKLHNPLEYKDRFIPAVELIAPKSTQNCPSALEHTEFVIDVDLDSFAKLHPDLDWDKSATSQPVFPMLKLKLSDNCQVKFHYKAVLEIIEEQLK